MSDLGEEPLVDWEVGFGMRKSELENQNYGKVLVQKGVVLDFFQA